MPVRIKQRTTSAELVREDEKQLETLRKQIVAMLLAWQNPVSVTLKSPESSKKLNIRGKDVSTVSSKSGNRKLDVTLICSVLSQAGIIEPSDWDSWVRTSARIAWVTVKGVVSLQPAPSKQAQFMSIGIRPISSEMGNNIFYDEINRLFASSTFGYEEDIFDAEDDNRTGKSSRFKKDGITNKQWKGGGKGVDRWPMFYIRIDIQNTKLFPQDEVDMLGEGTISSLIKVLGAMITSFLEENHFSPRVKLGRRKQERSTKPVAIERSQVSRYRGSTLLGSEAAHYIHAEQNFGTWSRIKMGKGSKSSGASPSLSSPDCRAKCELSTVKTLPENSMRTLQDLEASSAEVNDQIVHHNDEQRLEWRNPISGATILVNARTGLVIPLGLFNDLQQPLPRTRLQLYIFPARWRSMDLTPTERSPAVSPPLPPRAKKDRGPVSFSRNGRILSSALQKRAYHKSRLMAPPLRCAMFSTAGIIAVLSWRSIKHLCRHLHRSRRRYQNKV